ncbi:MAG: amidohydrolase family protein [Candidatus Bathyarchaeota archaeon]
MRDQRIIDSHAHFFPKKYLQKLDEFGINFGQTLDNRFTSTLPRLEDMDKAGVWKQVVSIAVPGVNMSSPENAVKLAEIVNNELSSLIAENDRFIGLASLPMLSPMDAVDELKRAVNDLGLKGIELFTDIGGRPLDSEEFWVVYEAAARLDTPIFIHPIAPKHRAIYDDYGLLAVLGFPFETTHAATRIALSGLLEKIPDLKLVLSHLGGTLPYLVGRIDDAYRMFGKSQTKIQKPPSEYLKKMYLDGASFYNPAWTCALGFWGPEKILMGSDYPYGWVGEYHRCVDVVDSLNLGEFDRDCILGGNAEKLFGLGEE